MAVAACSPACLLSRLLTYAFTRTANPDDAEDAAMEAVASLLASKSLDLALGEHIVRCHLLRAAEQRSRALCVGLQGDLLPIGLLADGRRPGFRVDVRKELGRIIEEAELPERQQACLLMRRDGWSVREIASRLHVSPRTVERDLAAGIRAIQARNPSFERLFYLLSRVTIKNSARGMTSLARMHLHRNPRNER